MVIVAFVGCWAVATRASLVSRLAIVLSVGSVATWPSVYTVLWLPVVFVGVWLVLDGVSDRRRRSASRNLPELAEALAAHYATHANMASAMIDSSFLVDSHLRPSFESAASELTMGLPVATALSQWRLHAPHHHEMSVLLAAVELSVTHGTALPLRHAVASLRLRRLRREDLAAQVAQARSSALVIGASPWVVLAIAAGFDPSYGPTLTSTTLGRWCLLGAAALSVLGLAAMRLAIRSTGLE